MDRTSPSFPVAVASRGTRAAIRWPIAVLAAVTLAACAGAPVSYLYDNQVYYRAIRDRFPVFVLEIDGSSPAFRPVPITPGQHLLRLDAQAVGGFGERVSKTYPITIEPCTRYYLAAQRQSQISQDWELVVERTFPVGGCDPAAERERAKTSAISAMPASSFIESVAVAEERSRR